MVNSVTKCTPWRYVGEGWYVASFTLRPFTVIGKLLTANQWHLVIFAEREDFGTAKIEFQNTSAYFPVLVVCTHDR
jgi:hypothetical protein